MENTERQEQILNYLLLNHFASIDEIAQNIYASGATVRRDIQKLEQKGFVKAVYGGVVLAEYSHSAVPISIRERKNSVAKEQIARKAAMLIQDNDTILLDSSSSCKRICKHITNRKNLTVFTNNLGVCNKLQNTNISVYCTGGILKNKSDLFSGYFTEEFLKHVNVDLVFFSASGLLENGDIVDYSEAGAFIRRLMLSRASKSIFLCDSSKFNNQHSFKICNVSDVSQIISDDPAIEEMLKPQTT